MNCPKCNCKIEGDKLVRNSYLCADCYYSLPAIQEALKQEWENKCNLSKE